MMRFQVHFKWNARIAGLVMGVILAGFLMLPVYANGTHPASQDVYSDEVGPYKLLVTTSPVLDFIHLSIYLATKGSEMPVPEANLTVSAEHIEGTGITVGPMAAPPINDNLHWYSADLPIQEAGVWTSTLIIDSPLAEERIIFPIFVRESGGLTTPLAVIGAAGVISVILWFMRRWKVAQRRN